LEVSFDQTNERLIVCLFRVSMFDSAKFAIYERRKWEIEKFFFSSSFTFAVYFVGLILKFFPGYY